MFAKFDVRFRLSSRLTLNPDAAVNAIPLQVVRRALEDGGLKAIGSLEFKVKERLERAQAMLFFRGDEDHRAGTDLTGSFLGLHGGFAFHDEIKMFAIFVKVIGRRGALLVVHDS